MTKFNKIKLLRLIFFMTLLVMINFSCQSKKSSTTEFCTEDDFETMFKIDSHCHVSVERTAFMELAVENNFKILTINYDGADDIPIEEQQRFAQQHINTFPQNLAYLTTFTMKEWDNSNWLNKNLDYLKKSFENGALGIKVWKNIGMVDREKDGTFIMIDNPKFDSIFNYLEKEGITVLGHLGEPKDCWLPLDEMELESHKKYYTENPQYHMFLNPTYPSYEEQINARDNLLLKHPNLRFVGAHLGSMEWSIEEMAKRLDMFPNMALDTAERMCHFQKIAQDDYQKVYNFFIKYQDRIIYGTDMGDYDGSEPDPNKLKSETHRVWKQDWKFLTTDETMTTWEFTGQFKGLKLPREVIEKIYYKNAKNWFQGI